MLCLTPFPGGEGCPLCFSHASYALTSRSEGSKWEAQGTGLLARDHSKEKLANLFGRCPGVETSVHLFRTSLMFPTNQNMGVASQVWSDLVKLAVVPKQRSRDR